MMKKLFLMAIGLLAFATVEAHQVQIPMSVQRIKNTGTISPIPKSPVSPPTISLEDNVIYLETGHPAYTLSLVDANGEVVYVVTIPADTGVVALPATFFGDYELQLYSGGNYYFYCDITL